MSRQVEGLRRFVGIPAQPGRTFSNVVVTAGGKGGLGTSSVTALIGLGLARAGRRVLVVDASEGSLHLFLGLSAEAGLNSEDVLGHSTPVEWVHPSLAVLTSGIHQTGFIASLSAMQRKAALARVALMQSEFDLVLIDSGSRLESVIQACSVGVGRLLTLTDAGRISLGGTFALLRGVSARFPHLPLQLVVNRERPESLKRVDRGIRTALQHFHGGPVETAGLIPFDAQLERSARGDGLLQDLATSSPAARAALRLGFTIALGPSMTPHTLTPALAATGS